MQLLSKRISLYAHLLAWSGLCIYTVYYRLTYQTFDVPADYLLERYRFFAHLNIILTVLYAFYIIGYGFMLYKRYLKWVLIINFALSIIILLRALDMIRLGYYVPTNSLLALLFTYQIIFSFLLLKGKNKAVNS